MPKLKNLYMFNALLLHLTLTFCLTPLTTHIFFGTIKEEKNTALIPKRTEKILHTGDKESLNRCGQ